jgi:U3 small nucleolar RNA-associated protein 13
LSLFLVRKDYKNAVLLALNLKHPVKLLNIIATVMKENQEADAVLGLKALDEAIMQLNDQEV